MKKAAIECVVVEKIKFSRLFLDKNNKQPVSEFTSVIIYKDKNTNEYNYFFVDQYDLFWKVKKGISIKINIVNVKKHYADIIKESIEDIGIDERNAERNLIDLSSNGEIFDEKEPTINKFMEDYMYNSYWA